MSASPETADVKRSTSDPVFGRLAAVAPPHTFLIGSAIFHYLGPAFAVLLFARVNVVGVAWLRIASAAAILSVWRRPWRGWGGLDRAGWRLLSGWGATLALMNVCFYLAIDRLPLGTVAAIEFLGPVLLASIGAQTRRNALAIMVAVGGVALLTHLQFAGEPLGLAFAFANAVLFTAYIVLGHRVAGRNQLGGIEGLAAAMLIATAVVTLIGGLSAFPALFDPRALAAGLGLGVASSVSPYVCDQLAMARIRRSTYALYLALLPATAIVIGFVVLGQIPSSLELAGVALVVVGVGIHREAGTLQGHGSIEGSTA